MGSSVARQYPHSRGRETVLDNPFVGENEAGEVDTRTVLCVSKREYLV